MMKYRVITPKTGRVREFSVEAPCTELILKMYAVAIQRLSMQEHDEDTFFHYLEGYAPLPQTIQQTVKSFVDGELSQSEAITKLSEEHDDLLKARREIAPEG